MLKNGLQGLPTVVILEDFDVYAFRIFLAQTCGEFHFAVSGIVVPDVTTHKTNYDDGRMLCACRLRFTAPRFFKRAGYSLRRGGQSKESQHQNASLAHPT